MLCMIFDFCISAFFLELMQLAAGYTHDFRRWTVIILLLAIGIIATYKQKLKQSSWIKPGLLDAIVLIAALTTVAIFRQMTGLISGLAVMSVGGATVVRIRKRRLTG